LTFASPHTNTDSQPLEEAPTRVVEFLLHKSLPDKNPTIVKRERDFSRSLIVSDTIPEVLTQSSDMKEIMWNFSLFKGERRLTLEDNPYFYEKLPTSAEKYDSQFRADPIQTFHHDKITVLIDNPGLTGRVILETAKNTWFF
jgi:hypothetical protein